MSILVTINSEQEEKVLIAFLNSLKFEYKTTIADQDEEIQSEFLTRYNLELDKAEKEIENGNFVLQSDVEKLLADRRRSLK